MQNLNEDAIRKDITKSLEEDFDVDNHFDVVMKLCTCNAAFEEDPYTELARIFRELADKCDNHRLFGSIRDINGNPVGVITGKLNG